jgi:hypothetical protein
LAEGFEDSEAGGGLSDAPVNPLGNAIVACYALERCYDVVLEPAVAVRGTTFILVVAFRMCDDALIILGVKLHRRDVDIPGTQVDEMYALDCHISLLKRGIRTGALHIYTSRQPPVLANRWTADGDARRPQWTVLGNADVSRCCGDSPTSYSVPINAAS